MIVFLCENQKIGKTKRKQEKEKRKEQEDQELTTFTSLFEITSGIRMTRR